MGSPPRVSQPDPGQGALQLGHSRGKAERQGGGTVLAQGSSEAELCWEGRCFAHWPSRPSQSRLNCGSLLLGGGAWHLPPSPSLPSLRATVLQGGPVTFQVEPVTQPGLLRTGRRLLPCQLGRGGGWWRGPLRGRGFQGRSHLPSSAKLCAHAQLTAEPCSRQGDLAPSLEGDPLSLTPWLQGKPRHVDGPGSGPQSQS